MQTYIDHRKKLKLTSKDGYLLKKKQKLKQTNNFQAKDSMVNLFAVPSVENH